MGLRRERGGRIWNKGKRERSLGRPINEMIYL